MTNQILSLFSTTVDLLTEAEVSRLVFMDRNISQPLSEDQRKVVYRIAKAFHRTPSGADRQLLLDALEVATVKGKPSKVMKVSPGSNFVIKVTKPEEDNYTGFKIVARRDDNGALLSNAGHDGTADPVQYVHLNDLQLEPDRIYRIRIQLEEYDTDGLADGNAVRKLTDAFLLTDNEIDT